MESHLADYEAKLRTAGRDDKHVGSTLQYIRSICASAGFEVLSDVAADPVSKFAGGLRDKGRGNRTIAAYLTAIKGFTKWLANGGKLVRDPLTAIRKPDPKSDRRRERRMLLHDEWHWLGTTLQSGESRFDMPGDERWLLYRVAIETGLRASELRSLTRGRLFWISSRPTSPANPAIRRMANRRASGFSQTRLML